jgi:hypothetical protein
VFAGGGGKRRGKTAATHKCVGTHAVGGLQLSVWARKALLAGRGTTPCEVHIAEVACGVGNVLLNKGAIGCFVELAPRAAAATTDGGGADGGGADGGARLLFINAHLAAHAHRVEDRRASAFILLASSDLAV